jgi:FKBP-type peptidyl-prolyl cis-trans isomerase
MTNDKDSVLYNYKTMSRPGQPYAVRMAPSSYKGDMFEMMYKLHVGDSASFAMRVDSAFAKFFKQPIPKFLDSNGYIVYHVKIDSVYTAAKVDEIEKKNREMQEAYMAKAENAEDSLINKYLTENKITVKPTESGLYIVIKEKGKGAKIKKGDNIEVKYKGMFTDGRVFDASDKSPTPVVFPIGVQQVISAWDEAVLTMNVGTKILLVTPSKMAYGSRGSQAIPPFSPLVFEIEVIGIKSDKK